jgi:hypothetical protein
MIKEKVKSLLHDAIGLDFKNEYLRGVGCVNGINQKFDKAFDEVEVNFKAIKLADLISQIETSYNRMPKNSSFELNWLKEKVIMVIPYLCEKGFDFFVTKSSDHNCRILTINKP